MVFSHNKCKDTCSETAGSRSTRRYFEINPEAGRYLLKILDMRIKAIVEKSEDGLYSVYSDNHFGNSYLGGFGDNVAKAKEDFMLSISEALFEQTETGSSVPKPEDIVVEFHYDIPSFFNFFDFINVSKFAEYAGINESKMRAYKSGLSFPGEKTTAKIAQAISDLGKELCAARL